MIKSELDVHLSNLKFATPYYIDTDRMCQVEMEEKSSFLIKGNLSNGTQALVKGVSTNMGIEFSLKTPVSLNQFGGDKRLFYPHDITTAVLAKTEMHENWKSIPEYFGEGCIRFKVPARNVPPASPGLYTSNCERFERVAMVRNSILANFSNVAAFLKDQCAGLAGWTSEKICRFFQHSPYPRGENVTAPIYTAVSFSEMNPVTASEAESIIQNAVKKIDKSANIPDSSCVFSFPNEWGDSETKIAALYDHSERKKILLPMSVYRQNGCNEPEMFCFLGTKKIPWSENDLQDKDVVITDNVEFAFWNRDRFLAAGKLLITFPETYGRYEFLDLKALNKAKKVYLLVANFANETIAGACLAQLPFAEAICDVLDDKSKFGVFMMSLDFERIPDDIQSTAKLAGFISKHKPQIKETYVATSLDDFRTVCGDLTQKIQRKLDAEKALRTLMEEPSDNTEKTTPQNKAERVQTSWAIRSIVDKGGHIELIAQEKTGKTNFAVTLAYGYITANQQKSEGLIPGRFWTASKTADKKAVYLDAELGKSRFNVIRDRVKGAYLPKKSKEAAELDTNFIYHDLYKDGIPYAKREHHQHILDLIAAAEREGTPGPVGLVIIDTRRGFTLNQVSLEPQLAELINKIRRLFGASVFVCHHMDEKNKAAGNTSVTTGKTGMITMHRDYVSPEESREKCNLSHPVKFQLSTYGAFQPAFDTEPFYAKCENGRWTLMEMVGEPNGLNTQFKPVEFDEKAILKRLVKEYKGCVKLTKSGMAEYLGITDDTLRERLK